MSQIFEDWNFNWIFLKLRLKLNTDCILREFILSSEKIDIKAGFVSLKDEHEIT